MILFAGPCVIESEDLTLEIARSLKEQLEGLPVEHFFKASFDKANRTSGSSFRGPGLKKGLEILNRVKTELKIPVLTDVHSVDQIGAVAEVVDVIQIPAFLCRQTDLIEAAVHACDRTGCRLNIKKGQFLAPWDVGNIVDKVRACSGKKERAQMVRDWLTITERGSSFGYNNLVVDMASFQCIQGFGVSAIYDATHSIQKPGAAAGGKSTGGARENLEVLARAAMAAGADGVFMEVHPEPSKAQSDGPNAFYLDQAGSFVRQLLAIRDTVVRLPKLLPESNANRSSH